MTVIWNCPLTPAGNIGRPSETLHGQWIKTACNDISSEPIVRGLNNAVCQMVRTAQKMVSCGWTVMKKTVLEVLKVLPVSR
jgi:hypothetical protein